ncbi:hypothetical protein Tco_1156222 [Tanacetum coccineum]
MDAEIKVLNREHSEKIKKEKELRKKRIHQFRWTTSSRFKPEKITDVHIHPNTKQDAITVYKGSNRRNFHVHKPFRFGDFSVTELKVIPGEIGIIPSLPAPKQVPSLSSGRKRKAQELELQGIFFIDVFGDEAFQRISDIHKVDVDTLLRYMVIASNINTPSSKRFYAIMRSMIENHFDREKLKSKKVKLAAIGYSLN